MEPNRGNGCNAAKKLSCAQNLFLSLIAIASFFQLGMTATGSVADESTMRAGVIEAIIEFVESIIGDDDPEDEEVEDDGTPPDDGEW